MAMQPTRGFSGVRGSPKPVGAEIPHKEVPAGWEDKPDIGDLPKKSGPPANIKSNLDKIKKMDPHNITGLVKNVAKFAGSNNEYIISHLINAIPAGVKPPSRDLLMHTLSALFIRAQRGGGN